MATLTLDASSPGAGGSREVRAFGARNLKLATATFAFDSSYPTGGEDVSGLWDLFTEVLHVFVAPRNNRVFEVDHTNKKLKLYTALGTEAGSASDQSSVTGVHLLIVGY